MLVGAHERMYWEILLQAILSLRIKFISWQWLTLLIYSFGERIFRIFNIGLLIHSLPTLVSPPIFCITVRISWKNMKSFQLGEFFLFFFGKISLEVTTPHVQHILNIQFKIKKKKLKKWERKSSQTARHTKVLSRGI